MGRAPCCDKDNVKRGPWSLEEDATLKSYVETHGTGGNWISLPKKAGLKRCGKSCRLRWLNYLRPDIKRGGFTEEEDNIICRLYCEIGSRWSVIASNLPGRTDNDVKNHWNTKLKKKLLSSSAGKMMMIASTTPLDYSTDDSSNATNTFLTFDDIMQKINKENHEFSPTSNFNITAAKYAKFPAFSGFDDHHQVPMQVPVYYQSEFGRDGESVNYDEYCGDLLMRILNSSSSSSSSSSISNSSFNSVDNNNNSAISWSYGEDNSNNNNNNNGGMAVDLGFGFELPGVIAGYGAFSQERSSSSSSSSTAAAAYGNYLPKFC